VSAERWKAIAAEAHRRVEVVEGVLARHEQTGESLRGSLSVVAPDVDWSTYLHWRRRYDGREGPAWERLLDERVPPSRQRYSEAVEAAACMLREVTRSMNTETAREHLARRFGPDVQPSDTWLRRVWAEGGLSYEASEPGQPVAEDVAFFAGGAGLALLEAADIDTGASLGLAAAVQEAGKHQALAQDEVTSRPELDETRDDRGRFTAAYNARWRAGVAAGESDERWAPDEDKRRHRRLDELATVQMKRATLARKLLCMGVTPLLTERRGFVGLEGPAGAWLGVLSATAYMPATLDKAVGELGVLSADEAMWRAHAQRWTEVSRRWTASGPGWSQWAWYVDATSDPYWTRRFAKAGKVSRVGRVMPCLTRVAIASGAGVPLVVETHAGTVSLKQRLLPTLEHLESALGPGGEVGRLTIVDSEIATAGLLWALHDTADRTFITVLKGAVRKGAHLEPVSDWQPYRDQDELRELWVDLNGKDAPEAGIRVRGVEMRRPNSRWPTTTVFLTNVSSDDLTSQEVSDAYLARWPKQEQLFRNARNGGGLERSHGYGGQSVTHLALETKLERAQRQVLRAQARRTKAEGTRDEIAEGTREVSRSVRTKANRLADKDVCRIDKEVAEREDKQERLQLMPREIYVRDTGRDSAMTCLKVTALMLLEFVLKEYFGGHTMEWRTFIEQFVMLPVTVRSSRSRVVYQIHANPRQPDRMQQLAAALDEINRRRLRRDERRLVFELLVPPAS
jgi:hypothetical protein